MRVLTALACSVEERDLGYCYQQCCVIRQTPLGPPDSGDQEAEDKSPLSPTTSAGPGVLKASGCCSMRSPTAPPHHGEQHSLIHKCNLDSSTSSLIQKH